VKGLATGPSGEAGAYVMSSARFMGGARDGRAMEPLTEDEGRQGEADADAG
jgi:hypothetical protein